MTNTLTKLARSASFERRKRASAVPPAKAAAPATKPPTAPAGGRVSKMVRSASFSRRRASSTAREGATSEESSSGESSPTSRCMSPDEDDRASNTPLSATLAGWMLKKHTHEKSMRAQWAKRYFAVNELRGTISMSKGPKKKASAVLPLADIKSVKVCSAADMGVANCFQISCPPVHLTLRAEDRDECRMWVRQLQLRVDTWQAKAANQVKVASFAPFAPHAVAPSHAAQRPQPEPRQDCMVPASEVHEADGRGSFREVGGGRIISEGRTAVEMEEAAPFDGGHRRRHHHDEHDDELDEAPRVHPPLRAAAPEVEEATFDETVELLSDGDDDDDNDDVVGGRGGGGVPRDVQPSGGARSPSPPASESKALPLPRDLEAMMSSDEDEDEEDGDDEDVEIAAARARLAPAATTRRRPQELQQAVHGAHGGAQGAAPHHHLAPPVDHEAAAAAAFSAAQPAEGMSWLSSLPSAAYDASAEQHDDALTRPYGTTTEAAAAAVPPLYHTDQHAPPPQLQQLHEVEQFVPAAALEAPSVDHALSARYAAPEGAAASHTAVSSYDDWDDDEEDDAPAPLPPHHHQQQRYHQHLHHDEAVVPLAASHMAVGEAPREVHVGNGIVADSNFVDDDWDDDEE